MLTITTATTNSSLRRDLPEGEDGGLWVDVVVGLPNGVADERGGGQGGSVPVDVDQVFTCSGSTTPRH